MTPLERPRAYLEAIVAGLPLAIPAELPSILREVARNLNVLADEAERSMLVVDEPDDY